MSNIAIVLGFALMLFLPCAVALLGSSEPAEQLLSAYADRLVEEVVKPKMEHVSSAPETPQPPAVEAIAQAPAAAPLKTLEEWGDLRDPLAPSRGPRPLHGRVAHAEIEALKARAIAARAHAQALAAVARAAAAKAEAAAADAEALEEDAAQAIQNMRRAA